MLWQWLLRLLLLRSRRSRCSLRSSRLAHRLQLFERLLVQRRLHRLLCSILVADDVRRLLLQLLTHILGHVQEGELLVPLLEHVRRIDKPRLMKDHLRPIKHEPPDRQPDDDRDVDRFPKPGAGAFVVERVEEMDQLMLFEYAIAVGTHLERWTGWRGLGRSFERGHELSCCDGCGTRKLRATTQKLHPGCNRQPHPFA